MELGFTMPEHHKHLVVLENPPSLQNVICCTLCSCTAFTIIGLPPGWYKEFEYRSRVARQSRTVLREMELDLSDAVEIRVWDTNTDTRYMVLPVQPPEAVGWPGDKLAEIVSGHVRMPGYIRGKSGVVVGISPPYPFPDASAHNLQSQDERTYDVSFRAEDLWSNAADPATVHVGSSRAAWGGLHNGGPR